MTTTIMPPISPSPRHRFTRDEYYRMADAGVFEDQRVELIEGEIIDMSPQREPHVIAIGLVQRVLQSLFRDCWVRIQSPLTFSNDTEPEPDVAVVPGSPRDYVSLGHHPKTALLVVEISASTLISDRKSKASLYSRANIIDYWILNLIDRQLEVHRNPTTEGYQSVTILKPTDSISPLALITASIPIADMLP